MSVGFILNLMNKLNKRILCEHFVSIILFYSTSSINLVMNLTNLIFYLQHTPPKKNPLNYKKRTFFHRHAYNVTQMTSRYTLALILCDK